MNTYVGIDTKKTSFCSCKIAFSQNYPSKGSPKRAFHIPCTFEITKWRSGNESSNARSFSDSPRRRGDSPQFLTLIWGGTPRKLHFKRIEFLFRQIIKFSPDAICKIRELSSFVVARSANRDGDKPRRGQAPIFLARNARASLPTESREV